MGVWSELERALAWRPRGTSPGGQPINNQNEGRFRQEEGGDVCLRIGTCFRGRRKGPSFFRRNTRFRSLIGGEKSISGPQAKRNRGEGRDRRKIHFKRKKGLSHRLGGRVAWREGTATSMSWSEEGREDKKEARLYPLV